MEGSQQCIEDFRTELKFRRDLFYKGLQESAPGVFSGAPPDGAFYAFVKINADWAKNAGITGDSLSWAMAEFLIKHGRIGCVPGVDFGPSCEGYIRFCTCRSREELTGALASMKETLSRRPQLDSHAVASLSCSSRQISVRGPSVHGLTARRLNCRLPN